MKKTKKKNEEHSSRVIESLRMLYEISTLIRSDLKIEDKFKQTLEKVVNAVCCHSASIFLKNDNTGKLEEVATIGTMVDLIETIDFDMGSGLSAWVAKQRKPVVLQDIKKGNRKHFKSFVSTPLISDDNLIGVLNIGHEQPNVFTDEKLRFLEIIAQQLAHLIERTQFEKELIEKNKALQNAHDEIKKQQKRIIEMEKFHVLAQMAASVNHEINNPLTTIIGNIELLLMTQSEMDDKVKEKLNIVLDEARRIGRINDKIRNIKRVVTEDYLGKADEKMIDIDSSSRTE